MPIVLRNTKKSALSYSELDGNFTYLDSFTPLNYSGSHTGSFTGSYTGSFTGSYTGSFTGSYTGSFSGSFNGNTVFPVTSSLTGSISGSSIVALSYGANVFSKVDATRNTCKLPSSQVGGIIEIINNGEDVLFISGGGVVINGNSSSLYPIYPNGAVNRVTNIQNNTWSIQPANTPITFAMTYEFIVNHTSGSQTNIWTGGIGNKGLISSSLVGAGTTSPPSNRIVLSPSASYWHTYKPAKAWATRLSVESNVLSTDVNQPGGNNSIYCFVQTAYLRATNSLVLTQMGTVEINNPDLIVPYGSNVATSSIGTPYGGGIGDNGTIYGSEPTLFSTGLSLPCGVGSPLSGSVSQHFFTFGVTIPATAITKTYRFLYTLDGFR